MIRLGVNIDHVATVRQARRTYEPDPVTAASLAMLAGADGITVHLREDRRHIQDRDVQILRQTIPFGLNLEMAIHPDVVALACTIIPDQITLVPEKREELTTEGGLDVVKNQKELATVCRKFQDLNIPVAMFIAPDNHQLEASKALGAVAVEFHTGHYADAKTKGEVQKHLDELTAASIYAKKLGLNVHMGHGLNYWNTPAICRIPYVEELNIGHAIISRAVLVGLERAVKEMVQLIRDSRPV